MKKALFTYLFLFSSILFAQQSLNSTLLIRDQQKLEFSRTFGVSDKDISGKPYFSEVFRPADVEGYEEIYLLRYNAAKDEMEFEKDGNVFYVVKSTKLKISFIGTKKSYNYIEYNNGDELVNGYLVEIKENNKVSLYKKEFIKLFPKKEASSAYGSDVPAHYAPQKDTYYIKKNDEIVPFPRNKKELIRMFPSDEKTLAAFLKTNNISFSTESDLLVLVNYLDLNY